MDNYKHLYEQTKLMLEKYQDEIVPGILEKLEKANGRGHTLRTESAERLEIIRDIPTDHLRELVQAEKEGRLVVLEKGENHG